MKNITLKEFFEELIKDRLNQKSSTSYYYKRPNFETENSEYIEIVEVDIMSSRFRTKDGDFSEFEWELEHSNIYKE